MQRYNIEFFTKTLKISKTNFLVVGSGLAGIWTALKLSENEQNNIILITKDKLNVNSSNLAQGGIATAISKNDSWQSHSKDTINAGRGITNKKISNILAKEGRIRVKELIKMGFEFDKENGKLSLGLEGAHSKKRILHAKGDKTGFAIHSFLLKKLKTKKNIKVQKETTLLEILTKNKTAYGAIIEFKGKLSAVQFNSIILATGGYSGAFSFSTNPKGSGGEAILIAKRAGARLEDLEFEQFHPTIFIEKNGNPFLISEAVRGAGARLVSNNSEDITKTLPFGALSGRDLVSQLIFNRKVKGRSSYLDTRHFKRGEFKKKFPTIFKVLKRNSVNPEKDIIPISPGAHFSIGGIKVNEFSESGIKRLFAIGECSCTQVHGANRLASNSLLEAIVFGQRAANNAQKYSPQKFFNVTSKQKKKPKANDFELLKLFQSLQENMWQNSGIIRTNFSLKKSIKFSNTVYKKTTKFSSFKSGILKDRAMLCTLISKSALKRKETRGCHQRLDYPTSKKSFIRHSIC